MLTHFSYILHCNFAFNIKINRIFHINGIKVRVRFEDSVNFLPQEHGCDNVKSTKIKKK